MFLPYASLGAKENDDDVNSRHKDFRPSSIFQLNATRNNIMFTFISENVLWKSSTSFGNSEKLTKFLESFHLNEEIICLPQPEFQ